MKTAKARHCSVTMPEQKLSGTAPNGLSHDVAPDPTTGGPFPRRSWECGVSIDGAQAAKTQ